MADQQKPNDNELNELLDNALQDFSKDDKSNNASAVATAGATGESGEPAGDSEEFFLEQAKLLAERMNTLFGGPDTPSGDVPPLPQDPEQILSGFKKMAEAAAMTLQGENSASDEEVAKYSDSIAQALKGLQEGTDNLNAPVSETDVAQMFGGLSLENAGTDDGNMFLPFMEGMMQSLLSAEILLPSIKELLEKYPKYLEENGDKISAEDKERYEKQLELYKIIEGHLESENANDSAKEKRDKFKVVLDDMRKLQEYGQPPEEILAETAGDLPMLDPAAAGAAAGNPQCPMM